MDGSDAAVGSGVLKTTLRFVVVATCQHVLVQSVGAVEGINHFIVGYLLKGEAVKRVGEYLILSRWSQFATTSLTSSFVS